MSTIPKLNVAYGLTDSLLNVFPKPIIALRAPLATDKAQLGTVWVNKAANTAYVLTSVINNVATWTGLGGAGTFSALTVTPGPVSLTGTTTINTTGTANTTIGNATGSVNLIGNSGVTGEWSVSSNLFVGDNISTTTGNISSFGTMDAGDTITAQNDITTIAGSVIVSLAGEGVTLPGPVNIVTGAGAPAGGLAVNVGDIYINTTAATAATRMYITTAAGVWTNFTFAA